MKDQQRQITTLDITPQTPAERLYHCAVCDRDFIGRGRMYNQDCAICGSACVPAEHMSTTEPSRE